MSEERDEKRKIEPPERRLAAAQARVTRVELQAVLIIWLGVVSALLGVLELIVVGHRLLAGGLTFGGAVVILIGLCRGAWAHHAYWRSATG